MISDWTVYGYIGDGYVLCAGCVNADGSGWEHLEGVRAPGAVRNPDGETLQGLLSIADVDPLGLSCDGCGEYVFEPDPEAYHEEYGHPDPVDGCALCEAVAAKLEEWAAEHEAGEHAGSPILHPVNVRGGWAEAPTPTGCPACEREYAPAPGQLELHALQPDPEA